jgi:hypothetical protein
MKDLQLPINAPQVRSVCVGTYKSYRGLFVLWQGDNLHLDFVYLDTTTDDAVLQNVELDVPTGANVLASVPDPAGYSGLLVGGDGLYHYSAKDAMRGSGYQRLDNPQDSLFRSVQQLAVSVVGGRASIWGLNQVNTLAYQEFSLSGGRLQLDQPAIPLMTYDQGGGRFAPLRQALKGQSVFVVGSDDQLRQLEHDVETKIWRTTDIKIPTLAACFEINSYTTRVTITDADSLPVRDEAVWLFASSPAIATINGFGVRLDHTGTLVKTDNAGALTVIIETNDISAPKLTIQGHASSTLLNGVMYQIDHLAKLNNALAGVKNGAELRKVVLQGGEPLVDPNQSDADLDDALKALKDLKTIADELPATQAKSLASTAITSMSTVSASTTDWGYFQWVGARIKEAAQWTIQKIKEGWAFVVTIGGKIFNFLLDTITQVGKAIWKVLETIGASLKKLVKFIGFLFEWDDIIKTHNVLVNFTNCGILWGLESMDYLKDQAQTFMEEMKAKAKSFDPAKASNAIGDAKIGKDSAKANAGKDTEAAKMESEMKSPGANFGSYQTDHGGVALKEKNKTKNKTKPDGIVQALFDMCMKVFGKVTQLIKTFGTGFISLFAGGDKSIGDLLRTMGSNLMVDGIEILEELVTGLFNLLEQVLHKLALLANEPISIPVLSALYKKLTKFDLTVLDAVCLILAIPLTIIYKLVRQESPTKIPGIKDYIEPNKYNKALEDWAASDKVAPKTHSSHIQTFWHKTFLGICDSVCYLLPFAKPIGGAFWFLFKTIPGWFDPTASISGMSIVFKWVIWGISVPLKFARPGNWWRMASWLVGVINPIVGFAPEKFVQAGYAAFVCFIQLYMLTPTYTAIEDVVGADRVDAVFRFSEYMTVLGKFGSALAGGSLGANVPASVLAIAATNGGFGMIFIHAVQIKDGKKAEAGSIDMLT